MDTLNIKDPDSIIIDTRAGILALDQEGTALDIFRYYAHRLESDREKNPEHSIRIDIGTGYFFFSGFKESNDIFKFIYDNKLLNAVKNPNWSTTSPIRVVIGKETDKQTKDILLSIVRDQLSSYDGKKIDFLRRLIEEGLMKFKVFEDKKFHVKMYNFYFTNPESYAEPISYDRWAELHWKKQLNGTLTPGGEKELEELETENTKTIESVHDAIANDKQIQQQIEKIKGHEWVKIIEGET